MKGYSEAPAGAAATPSAPAAIRYETSSDKAQPHYEPPQKGEDLHYNLSITLEESVSGAEKKLALQQEQEVHEISVRIPAGISTGKKLRLAGKGYPGVHGGPAGDLYLNITILPHPIFARDGNDIYIEKSVSFTQAVLGTQHRGPDDRRDDQEDQGSRPGRRTGRRSG